MKLALLSPVLALAALGLAACGDSEMASNDETTAQNEVAANETPDYRFNPPDTAPDLNTIAPPTDPAPRPLDPGRSD